VLLIEVRLAEPEDEDVLGALDRESMSSPTVSPGGYREQPFFTSTLPIDVLVAVAAGTVVGYVTLQQPSPLPSNAHVLMVNGLGVAGSARGQGIGARLLAAVDERAAELGASRITLRVLALNAPARALYERAGYRVEGVLEGEFRLPVGPGGAVVPVDDVLMAKRVAASGSGSAAAH
jgi:ribosomal protein S18 acetylase RimI-like enzyme